MATLLGLYNYWIAIFLMMTGFYVVIAHGNLVKKIVGLNIFQVSVFILYISMGKVQGGSAPILLQSIAARVDSYRHRRRCSHHRPRSGPGDTHQ
jgi:multicomponent Na+:H+ antiporter subunit C